MAIDKAKTCVWVSSQCGNLYQWDTECGSRVEVRFKPPSYCESCGGRITEAK